MGVFAGPEIVEDGLVLALDAGNTKGYDKYENLITYSEKIGGSSSPYGWVNQNSIETDVDTPDVSDPSGGNSASKLTNGSTNPASQTLKPSSLSATVYTASVYLRTLSGTETASFNVFLKSSPYTTIATSGELTITSEWRRYDITTSTATSADYNFGIQVRSGTIYAWGAQLEQGSSLTDYYATTGTTKTRGSVVSSGIGTLTGTLTNGVGYDNVNGGSLSFDGTNDYISFSSNPSLTNQITVEVWVKLEDPQGPNNAGLILGRESSYRMIYYSTSVDWICSTENNSWYSTGTVIAASSLSLYTQIYQIVGTYDGSNNRIYVNGTLRNTNTNAISGNIRTNGTYYLMRTIATNVDWGQGIIYSHKLYNRALTASEIKQNFNATRGRFGI